VAGRKLAYHDPCLVDPVPDLDLDPFRGHDDAVMAVRARVPIVAAGVVRWAQKED